ncbi:MAG: sugar ABC transporter ATP-binding protein, partial [Desulfobacterales bacterium]|nr:sugar ABC transporter ATP-binding protein [Desulfobacterales bacterium]
LWSGQGQQRRFLHRGGGNDPRHSRGNGAGKSTLMKILSGYIGRTSGTILLDNVEVGLSTPAEAAQHGIGMLYQDPLDFPPLSVLENFIMGQSRGLLNRKNKYAARLRKISAAFNFSLGLESPVKSLTVGERQQLEILRLLELGIRVLILDEPTTGISVAQKEILFNALRKLASEGKTVIVVSHKLEDVEVLCDKVTVLRQGRTIGDMAAPFDTNGLLEMMFGKKLEPPAFSGPKTGKEIMKMHGIYASGGRTGLDDCNAEIRQGEVVGLAGLEGSGQGLFLRVAAGVKKPSRGALTLNGHEIHRGGYHRFQKEGVMFLPTNRLEEGLISGLTISEHFAVKDRATRFFLDSRVSEETAQSRISEFRIKGS